MKTSSSPKCPVIWSTRSWNWRGLDMLLPTLSPEIKTTHLSSPVVSFKSLLLRNNFDILQQRKKFLNCLSRITKIISYLIYVETPTEVLGQLQGLLELRNHQHQFPFQAKQQQLLSIVPHNSISKWLVSGEAYTTTTFSRKIFKGSINMLCKENYAITIYIKALTRKRVKGLIKSILWKLILKIIST